MSEMNIRLTKHLKDSDDKEVLLVAGTVLPVYRKEQSGFVCLFGRGQIYVGGDECEIVGASAIIEGVEPEDAT